MGLGGYLAAKSDADHFVTERQREGRSITLFATLPLIKRRALINHLPILHDRTRA